MPHRTQGKVELIRWKVAGKPGHKPFLWLPGNSKVGQSKQFRSNFSGLVVSYRTQGDLGQGKSWLVSDLDTGGRVRCRLWIG